MEALTAVSVAALTVYDMCKAVDRGMTVTDIRLTAKSGGKSGSLRGRLMISVEEARGAYRRRLPDRCRAEQVALAEAVGRVLAEDLAARRTQPPFAVSAMDGYAVRAADVASVPVRLKIVGYAPGRRRLGGGAAARRGRAHLHRRAVARGRRHDRHPGGYRGATTIMCWCKEAGPKGSYVRPAGLDFGEGDLGLAAGSASTPATSVLPRP